MTIGRTHSLDLAPDRVDNDRMHEEVLTTKVANALIEDVKVMQSGNITERGNFGWAR